MSKATCRIGDRTGSARGALRDCRAGGWADNPGNSARVGAGRGLTLSPGFLASRLAAAFVEFDLDEGAKAASEVWAI